MRLRFSEDAPLVYCLLAGTIVFAAIITLAGCAPSEELVQCRELIPKCGQVIGRQREELDDYGVKMGLCNDLNSALMENNKRLKSKKAPKKYDGDPYQKEKA